MISKFKFILFLVMLFLPLDGHCQIIKYQLSQLKAENGRNFIHIEMDFQSDESGVTKLLLPNRWVDAENLFENIINISVQNNLEQNIKILNSDTSAEKYIISSPNTNLKLSYDLVGNNQHNFKPYITKEYFSFIGKAAFIIPKFQGYDSCNEVILQWDLSRKNHSYQVVNSYGLNQYYQKITIDELLEGVFLGGKLFVSEVRDGNNLIIFAYNKRSASQAQWEKDATDLIVSQRAAIEDNNIPYYLVSSIVDDTENELFSATHLRNSVLFIYNKNWLVLPRQELIRYMAHEFFHHWVGQKIKGSHDYVASMWFFEGFNDFLSIELAFKAGLLTNKAYIDIKNRVLKAQYISPFQSISNRDLALYYWDNPELHGVPYFKGHLFAQYCEQMLKKQNRSLLDVVRLLTQPGSRYYKNNFTEMDLINVLAELISSDVYDAYVKYFVKCEYFEREIDLGLNGYRLEFIDIDLPKYDIDIKATFLENKIIGLAEKSEAFQLGLREGEPISLMKIDPLLKKDLIEIHVRDYTNVSKIVALKPHYNKSEILAFKMI